MNYKIELTREELTTILQVATGNVKDFVMDNDKFINKHLAAINYTHSCETLKDEEEMTFTKWLNKWNWEQIGNSYVFKRGESYTDAESLMKSYKKEYNL
jgi:hypothetical protein